MAEPFIGEIRINPGNKLPAGWALCDGTILKIAEHDALFSLIGTTYGGDGQKTFALPDLRGRVPIGQGQGPGLSPYRLGQKGGSEAVALSYATMPLHNHNVETSVTFASTGTPANHIVALEGEANAYGFDPSEPRIVDMDPEAIGASGEGREHLNMQPYLVTRYIIALVGLYPEPS